MARHIAPHLRLIDIARMNRRLSSPPNFQFGWPESLIVVATLLELFVALHAHHFPYRDPTNHLARYTLIERIWFGDPPGYVVMRWVPTSYIAGDVVGALLVHFAGALATLRLIDFAILTLLPLGMYVLLLHAAPAQRGWALVGVLFGFASHFLNGYLNYSLGIGLVFCWLAIWYPRRENASWIARVMLAVGAMVLFLVHLSAPLLALVVIWTDYIVSVIGEDVIAPPSRWHIVSSRLSTILIVTAAVALVWVGASYSGWGDAGPAGEYEFRHFGDKLIWFTDPFRSISRLAAVIIALGYAASLGTMLYLRRRTFRPDAFTASAVIMFVLYLVFPQGIPGAYSVDIRWLATGYLLLFCAHQRTIESEPRRALLVPFVACLLHIAAIGWTAQQIDRDLDQYEAALRRVPPRTTLLPLGDGIKMYSHVPVMEHFVLWHIIDAHGRAPGLFNYYDQHDQDPLNHHLAHFVERAHLFLPDSKWGAPDTMPGLPWRRIDKEYDYIIQVAVDEHAKEYVERNADEIWHDDRFVIYKVRKP
jgi:hypothetical protein